MKQKIFLFCLLCTLLLIGCTQTYVQVAQVKCDDCKEVESYLVYENDTIRVVYYFWNENGVMGFSIQNRTKVPLYIDWKKCSYIYKSTKNDYWSETTTENTYDQSNTSSITGPFTKWAFSWTDKTYGTSTTQITKLERVTFIPPGASISRGLYNIKNSGIVFIKSKDKETHDTLITVDKEGANSKRYTEQEIINYTVTKYDAKVSPISFSSFLTYSTDEKFTTEFYVNSKFYVADIVEMPWILFKSTSLTQSLDDKTWASPSKFYMKGSK